MNLEKHLTERRKNRVESEGLRGDAHTSDAKEKQESEYPEDVLMVIDGVEYWVTDYSNIYKAYDRESDKVPYPYDE